jgi:hypothetical protein
MMRYDLTPRELVQALHRIRTAVADADRPEDRALLCTLLVLAQVPGMDTYFVRDASPDVAARLDWALERE